MSKPPDPSAIERGRKGGLARAEKARKRRNRSFLDALRERVSSNPDELVNQLVGTAAGAVVAARVLEKAGDFEALPEEPEKPAASPAGVGLADLVALSYRTGNAQAMGLPTTAAELEELMAAGDESSSASGSRARDVAAITEPRASASTSGEDGGEVPPSPPGGRGERRNPASSREQVSVPAAEGASPPALESLPKPRPRYADPTSESVFRWRAAKGLPTGNPNDPYLNPGDDGHIVPATTAIGGMRQAIAEQQGVEQRSL